MPMTEERSRDYREDSFLALKNHFSKGGVSILKAEIPQVFTEDSPGRVLKKGINLVRSGYGSRDTNPIFHRLTRHPRIFGTAMQTSKVAESL